MRRGRRVLDARRGMRAARARATTSQVRSVGFEPGLSTSWMKAARSGLEPWKRTARMDLGFVVRLPRSFLDVAPLGTRAQSF